MPGGLLGPRCIEGSAVEFTLDHDLEYGCEIGHGAQARGVCQNCVSQALIRHYVFDGVKMYQYIVPIVSLLLIQKVHMVPQDLLNLGKIASCECEFLKNVKQ